MGAVEDAFCPSDSTLMIGDSLFLRNDGADADLDGGSLVASFATFFRSSLLTCKKSIPYRRLMRVWKVMIRSVFPPKNSSGRIVTKTFSKKLLREVSNILDWFAGLTRNRATIPFGRLVAHCVDVGDEFRSPEVASTTPDFATYELSY